MDKLFNLEELAASLLVWRLPGVGPQLFFQLKSRFGNMARLFGQEPEHLNQTGLKPQARSLLKNLQNHLSEEGFQYSGRCKTTGALVMGVHKDLLWLQQPGHHLLMLDKPGYPDCLKAIYAPPPLLFVKGNPNALQNMQIGVVGSRNASRTGQENTRAFVHYLVKQGLSVTSGLALGIDGIAHQAALAAGGKTIAVVANGLDQVYPKRHLKLAEEIVASEGAIVSEFPIATQPRPQHFPRRNRIISGLSQGVLVVEAALKSGSLITARYAMEQGREVFAVPGSIHNPLSKGCHALIKQGAALVETGEDMLSELQLQSYFVESQMKMDSPENKIVGEKNNKIEKSQAAGAVAMHPSLKAEDDTQAIEEQIIAAMGFETVTLDTLVELTGIETAVLASTLIMLELQGKILQEVDGYILTGEYA